MNKRTLILAAGSLGILMSAMGYRMMSNLPSTQTVKSASVAPVKNPASTAAVKQQIKVPARGVVATSVDALASQIVANSPNQEEAYSFLVEAKSYRIQELRARRAKEKAAEEKARYDADMWARKRDQIDDELAKASEKDSVDTQSASRMNRNRIRRDDRRQTAVKEKSSVIELSQFALRAIIKEGSDYIARLNYDNKSIPAKQGYKLFGKVDVKSVSAQEVVLAKDEEQVTLYAY